MLFRKLFTDCRWPSCPEQNDNIQQQFQLPRRSLVLHSISETTLNIDESLGNTMDIDTQNGASNSQRIIKRRPVPVLFSTNRGIFLRVPKKTLSSYNELSSNGSDLASDYNISFCDLERWSTNRAHHINLADTFTIARSALEDDAAQPLELHVPNQRICFSHQNNNRYLPIKRAVHFYNAFSRFETRY